MSNIGSTERIIDGKKYYRRTYGSKAYCEREAAKLRSKGHSARVLQGYENWMVYSRYGK